MGNQDDRFINFRKFFLAVADQITDDPMDDKVEIVLFAFQVIVVDVIEEFGELGKGLG